MSIEKVMNKRTDTRSRIRKALNPFRSWLVRDVRATANDTQMLLGKMACWRTRSLQTIASLQEVEFKVTSQWGEDGIIDWLIERAAIPTALHTFVEFGVDTYREANTRFLLQNRNWRGFIMDGSGDVHRAVIEDDLFWRHHLTIKQAFITRENVNDLIASSGLAGDIGLLSVDVDGNDYWVWQAIDVVRPVIVICEYNAVFGDLHPISTPYHPAFYRTDAHYSNLYFGASIAALRSLAAQKGYRFVGTTAAANDAFFVREDYASRFVDTSLLQIQALPSAARESIDSTGMMTYVSGLDRLPLIADMPVINTQTGETIKIGQLGQVYSPEWLARIANL